MSKKLDDIEKLLKKMGWEHLLGQHMIDGIEVHYFIKDKDLIQVSLEEDVVDEDMMKLIKGDLK